MKLSPAKRTLLLALPLGVLIGAAGAYAASPKLDEADGHVDKAILALKAAYNPKVHREFGGHGKRALELLDDVKREIKKAKEYDDKYPPTLPKPGPTANPKPMPGPKPPDAGPGPKPPEPGPKPPGPGPKPPGPGPKPPGTTPKQ